jgi:uncharacterized membrane protein YfcA
VEWWVLYIVVGIAAGLLAGLLGVGGGVVVVPCLVFAFHAQGLADRYVMPLALGTSLAAIVVTAAASVRAHHGRGAVEWMIVRRLAPGLAFGALGGAWCATWLSSNVMKGLFAGFLWLVATQLVFDGAPRPTRELPGAGGLFVVGGGIGMVSGMMGIGGGALSIPFLLRHRVPIHRTIGTAAAAGLPIAVAGATGYLVTGLAVADLPSRSLGFIHLPALAGVAIASMATAPMGAALAHRTPTHRLKAVFAGLLYVVGAKLAFSAWSG